MTTYYSDNMIQEATYWPPGSPDTFGKVAYGAGVEILVRWEDRKDLISDNDGNQIVTSAVVYAPILLAAQGRIVIGHYGDDEPEEVGGRIIKQVAVSRSLDEDVALVKAWI